MSAASWTPERLVDATRHPILGLDGAEAQALIARERAALAEDGLCLLHGFVTAEALAAMAAEAQRLAPAAHRRERMNAVWTYDGDEPGWPADHPRRRRHLARHGTIGCDELGPESATRALYGWDGLTRFIAALTDSPSLYRCADPLVSCVVTVLGDGDAHAWHYDDNDFVVSLLLQAPLEGGIFEYAPNIRTGTDENYEAVGRIFDGDRSAVRAAPIHPGTLSLFRGRRSLHHVTPVKGARPRLMALFSYHREPGLMFRAETHLQTLGRTLAAA